MAEYIRKDKLIEYLRESGKIPNAFIEIVEDFPVDQDAGKMTEDDYTDLIKNYNPGPVPDIYGVYDR